MKRKIKSSVWAKKQLDDGSRVCGIRIFKSFDKKCNHKWEFIKGGLFRSDKFICKKCAGFKLIS